MDDPNSTFNAINPSTRFAEGFLFGAKLAAVHSVLYAPFYAKELSLASGRHFRVEYSMQCCRAFGLYAGVLSMTFLMRHYVSGYKDQIVRGLHHHVPFLKGYR